MRLLVVLLITLGSSHTARALTFEAGLDGEWRFEKSGEACVLKRSLGRYGEVRFTGEPGRVLQLQVLPLRDLFGKGAVTAQAVAPEWHQSHPAVAARGELHHVNGGVVSARDPVATSLLMDLYGGFALKLSQPSWFGGAPVEISVSAVRFRAAYDTFASCFQWLMPANFEDVERTRVTFSSNGAKLSEAQRAELAQVAEYVLADRDVRRIYVDGHTDTTGDERNNMRLSERRARAVAEYLGKIGVPQELLVVRFHAARYPIAKGSTSAAHAQNRRTTVRLDRGGEAIAGL